MKKVVEIAYYKTLEVVQNLAKRDMRTRSWIYCCFDQVRKDPELSGHDPQWFWWTLVAWNRTQFWKKAYISEVLRDNKLVGNELGNIEIFIASNFVWWDFSRNNSCANRNFERVKMSCSVMFNFKSTCNKNSKSTWFINCLIEKVIYTIQIMT